MVRARTGFDQNHNVVGSIRRSKFKNTVDIGDPRSQRTCDLLSSVGASVLGIAVDLPEVSFAHSWPTAFDFFATRGPSYKALGGAVGKQLSR